MTKNLNRLLRDAASRADLSEMARLLALGADPLARDRQGNYAAKNLFSHRPAHPDHVKLQAIAIMVRSGKLNRVFSEDQQWKLLLAVEWPDERPWREWKPGDWEQEALDLASKCPNNNLDLSEPWPYDR